ncbi:hypothetical protein FQN57_005285 [Myotisia sp. PD_48]|nr:hypothetical protein FQN57_005285 [Myotisia sp. PD_48]
MCWAKVCQYNINIKIQGGASDGLRGLPLETRYLFPLKGIFPSVKVRDGPSVIQYINSASIKTVLSLKMLAFRIPESGQAHGFTRFAWEDPRSPQADQVVFRLRDIGIKFDSKHLPENLKIKKQDCLSNARIEKIIQARVYQISNQLGSVPIGCNKTRSPVEVESRPYTRVLIPSSEVEFAIVIHFVVRFDTRYDPGRSERGKGDGMTGEVVFGQRHGALKIRNTVSSSSLSNQNEEFVDKPVGINLELGSASYSPSFDPNLNMTKNSEDDLIMTQGDKGGGDHRGGRRSKHYHNPARDKLALVSKETKDILPLFLHRTPHAGRFINGSSLPPHASTKDCPGFTETKIRVVTQDTIDAAIDLINHELDDHDGDTDATNNTATSNTTAAVAPTSMATAASKYGYPCILNMASRTNPGGGWLRGASAQEEELCRRSTLSESLKREFYPIPHGAAIYTDALVVFRSSRATGHKLQDLNEPDSCPVLSAISIAALVRPAVKDSFAVSFKNDNQEDPENQCATKLNRKIYANEEDRNIMKEKMRLILRISIWKGHRKIVLGAFGCGAFRNPKEEVADCWAEVFGEPEFQGGWWKDVVFAVLDPPPRGNQEAGSDERGNAGTFIRRLDGLPV